MSTNENPHDNPVDDDGGRVPLFDGPLHRWPGCRCRALTPERECPATPAPDAASTPASEGLTEADVRDRLIAWVEAEGLSVPATARLMLILRDRDKIRVADAEAKARADERARIAEAILDARHGWHNEVQRGFARAARIARGDA